LIGRRHLGATNLQQLFFIFRNKNSYWALDTIVYLHKKRLCSHYFVLAIRVSINFLILLRFFDVIRAVPTICSAIKWSIEGSLWMYIYFASCAIMEYKILKDLIFLLLLFLMKRIRHVLYLLIRHNLFISSWFMGYTFLFSCVSFLVLPLVVISLLTYL